jgi:hypothetical protein
MVERHLWFVYNFIDVGVIWHGRNRDAASGLSTKVSGYEPAFIILANTQMIFRYYPMVDNDGGVTLSPTTLKFLTRSLMVTPNYQMNTVIHNKLSCELPCSFFTKPHLLPLSSTHGMPPISSCKMKICAFPDR